MIDPVLLEQARALVAKAQGLKLATAESCTGGLVAAVLTEVAGASSVFACGFVTYSNAAKSALLGVAEEDLRCYGAVSAPVARAMALGALRASAADITIAITGIAGPDGGSAEKPVGLVHFACARRGGDVVSLERRFGNVGRSAVRLAAVAQALALLAEAV